MVFDEPATGRGTSAMEWALVGGAVTLVAAGLVLLVVLGVSRGRGTPAPDLSAHGQLVRRIRMERVR